jgi:hypothetical protein
VITKEERGKLKFNQVLVLSPGNGVNEGRRRGPERWGEAYLSLSLRLRKGS